MSDAAIWLKAGFIRVLRNLSEADQQLFADSANQLLEAWNQPQRTFHNQKYLLGMLSQIDDSSALTHDSDLLTLASWFHGAIARHDQIPALKTGGILNISASADYAHTTLVELGVPGEDATRVGELILMLGDWNPPDQDMDAQVFIDASLAFLGVPPQEYREMLQLWRGEFPTLEDAFYLRLRRSYVKKLLGRAQIYTSPAGSDLEAVAQQNLAGELAKLNSLLPDQTDWDPDALRTTRTDVSPGSPSDEAVVIKAKAARTPRRKSIMPTSNNQASELSSSVYTPDVLDKAGLETAQNPVHGIPSNPDKEEKTAQSDTKSGTSVSELLKEQSELAAQAELEQLNSQHNSQSTMESVADILSTMTQLKPIRDFKTPLRSADSDQMVNKVDQPADRPLFEEHESE